MLYGVGASLARQLDEGEMRVLPTPSAYSLAAARLGWPLQDITLLSVVARPLPAVARHLHDGQRLLILCNDGSSPSALAALLRERGFGASRLSVLEHLGGPQERRIDGLAASWSLEEVAALNLLAVECRADANVQPLPVTIGLPDDTTATTAS